MCNDPCHESKMLKEGQYKRKLSKKRQTYNYIAMLSLGFISTMFFVFTILTNTLITCQNTMWQRACRYLFTSIIFMALNKSYAELVHYLEVNYKML